MTTITGETQPQFGKASPWPTLLLILGILALFIGVGLWITYDVGPPRNTDPAASAPSASSFDGPPASQPVGSADSIWAPNVCSWALGYLTEDAQLDRASAAGIQSNGPDPRWPRATAGEYLTYAARWDQIGSLVSRQCANSTGGGATSTVPACSTAIDWLQMGAAAHDADLKRVGATEYDSDWNKAWAAFYRSLAVDLGLSCIGP